MEIKGTTYFTENTVREEYQEDSVIMEFKYEVQLVENVKKLTPEEMKEMHVDDYGIVYFKGKGYNFWRDEWEKFIQSGLTPQEFYKTLQGA